MLPTGQSQSCTINYIHLGQEEKDQIDQLARFELKPLFLQTFIQLICYAVKGLMDIVKKPENMDSNHKKPEHSTVWRDHPEAQDYPAASSDLCLLLHPPSPLEKLLNRLQAETISQLKAKDIFHVACDLGRHQLIIADGDHHFTRCICRMKMPSFLARCFH